MNVRALLPLLCCALVSAQSLDQREATVGMRAVIEQIVLEGSELEPAPSTFESPIRVRVLKIWPHGEHLRYDLEWVGMEPGDYDLRDALVRKDGSSTDGLPSIPVTVTSLLPVDVIEPSELVPEQGERMHGYSTLQVVVGVLWLVGLVAILFVGRKRRPKPAPPVPEPTLADRLRPIVEDVAAGRADDARKAQLERMLVAFWRERLGLGKDVMAVDAIVAIKRHDEAGALLRRIEQWLHMPEPPRTVDIGELLAPYRNVAADSVTAEGR